MNKRKFLKTSILGAIVGLVAPSIFAKSNNYPKIGYLSVDTCREIDSYHGDWIIIDNRTGNSPIPKDYGYNVDGELSIWSLNDKEGWVNALVMDKKHQRITYEYQKFYGDFRLIYKGKNPKYQHFK